MSAEHGRLMRAGYSYGGDSTGVRVWARPGGGLVFEDEALKDSKVNRRDPCPGPMRRRRTCPRP
jgi:hypothetical protein